MRNRVIEGDSNRSSWQCSFRSSFSFLSIRRSVRNLHLYSLFRYAEAPHRKRKCTVEVAATIKASSNTERFLTTMHNSSICLCMQPLPNHFLFLTKKLTYPTFILQGFVFDLLAFIAGKAGEHSIKKNRSYPHGRRIRKENSRSALAFKGSLYKLVSLVSSLIYYFYSAKADLYSGIIIILSIRFKEIFRRFAVGQNDSRVLRSALSKVATTTT